MTLSWKSSSKNGPQIILNRIEKCRNTDSEGRMFFSGYELDQNLSALKAMINFPSDIPDLEKSKFIWNAIKSEKGQYSPSTILKKINKSYIEIIESKSEDYFILTSISADKELLPKTINILDVNISFSSSDYPSKYSSRYNFLSELSMIKNPNPPAYTKIIAHTKEKTPFRAAYKALNAIDFYRAIICLLVNPLKESRSYEWYPINKVRLGEFHSVHLKNGQIYLPSYWFEPNFVIEDVFTSKESIKLKTSFLKWVNRIKRIPYSNVIVESLIRFVRALDEKDPYTSLIKLWSATEYLCCGEYAKYNNMISRLSNIFKEKDYNILILEYLRNARNITVHVGNQIDSARTDCYLLQFYFYNMVKFLISNYKCFHSIEDAYDFLDLPIDINILQAKKKMIEHAINFRQ